MLSLTEQFGKNSIIIRTRNESLLSKCDIVVDVGSVYDPSKNRFDHHQSSFQDTFNSNYKTRLSSAGLIYKHFGPEIINCMLGKVDKALSSEIVDRIYKNFIEHIDGNDNVCKK